MFNFIAVSSWLLFCLKCFHIFVDAFHLSRNINALGAMALTLSTTNAMICLTQTRNAAVITNEEGTACFFVLRVTHFVAVVIFVDTFVVVLEDARDIDSIRTGHAILAVGAGNERIVDEDLSHVIKHIEFLVGTRIERTISAEVVFEMFHVSHTAKHSKYFGETTRIAESPGSNALRRTHLLHTLCSKFWNLGEAAAEEGLHDNGGNIALLELAEEIFAIGVRRIYLLGMLPIDIIELNLHEIPMILTFVVKFKEIIHHLYITVIAPTEITNATLLLLFYAPVEHTVVEEARMKSFHTVEGLAVEIGIGLANAVEEIVVNIVRLKHLQTILKHLHTLLVAPRLSREIGKFRGDEEFFSIVASEGDARCLFAFSFAVGR